MNIETIEVEANKIFENIKDLIEDSKNKVYSVVNTEMLKLYWNIGKSIIETQNGNERANYGDEVLENLSHKLTNAFGKGFSKRNLERMRKFYSCFPIPTTLSSQLSWSHYLELIKIKENNKRNFSTEFKFNMPTEEELINAVEEKIQNYKINEFIN